MSFIIFDVTLCVSVFQPKNATSLNKYAVNADLVFVWTFLYSKVHFKLHPS